MPELLIPLQGGPLDGAKVCIVGRVDSAVCMNAENGVVVYTLAVDRDGLPTGVYLYDPMATRLARALRK
jgi:hypothetical protein